LVYKADHKLDLEKLAPLSKLEELQKSMHSFESRVVTTQSDLEKKLKTFNEEFEKYKTEMDEKIEDIEKELDGDNDEDEYDDEEIGSEGYDEFDMDGDKPDGLKNSNSGSSSKDSKDELKIPEQPGASGSGNNSAANSAKLSGKNS
jgi:hypothetical protein